MSHRKYITLPFRLHAVLGNSAVESADCPGSDPASEAESVGLLLQALHLPEDVGGRLTGKAVGPASGTT